MEVDAVQHLSRHLGSRALVAVCTALDSDDDGSIDSMNYLRGAVSAISAPYQYYKELPPLNPSTLTGAIDVIVIQRPTDNGDTELVCSPFHVRFGKWQVLRPGEKKVRNYVVHRDHALTVA